MSRHYLDHASSTPLRPGAAQAVREVMEGHWGDPARAHHEGRLARVALEGAREEVAGFLGCRASQVVFTSGGTESVNMAVRGLDERAGTILCAGVEHSAVRQSSARTAPLAEIPVDRYGRVRPEAVEQAAAQVDGVVGLVHCQWANHEVGTLQPVAEVAEVAHRLGALVHVDGAAAVGHVAGAVAELGADLFSFSSHKLGGPTGVGVLVVRRGLRLEPYLVGGEQERGRRGGLENLAGAVGLAGALAELDPPTHVAEIERARRHTERVIDLVRSIDGTELYGDPERRAPHIVCFGVEGVEAEAVVISLDQAGVAVHSGSACSSESFEPSPVLAAMGVDADRSIRVSVGWNTVEEDLDALEATLPDVVGRLRSLRTA